VSRAKFWLLAIAVLYALGGFLLGISGSAAYESEVAFTGIVVFPLYVLTYLWMKADAQERSSASPPGAIPLVAVLLQMQYRTISLLRGMAGAKLSQSWGWLVSLFWWSYSASWRQSLAHGLSPNKSCMDSSDK
jgi:hypothetical protein